jgi:hypothetical protein
VCSGARSLSLRLALVRVSRSFSPSPTVALALFPSPSPSPFRSLPAPVRSRFLSRPPPSLPLQVVTPLAPSTPLLLRIVQATRAGGQGCRRRAGAQRRRGRGRSMWARARTPPVRRQHTTARAPTLPSRPTARSLPGSIHQTWRRPA